MPTLSKFFVSSILLMVLLCNNACKGPQGDPGPQGAAGAIGAVGAAGPAGPAGTANVIYSDWVSTAFTGSGTSYTASINAPKITQEMLDKADIRVYWKLSNYIIGLPYAQNSSGTISSLYQRIFVGRIDFIASYALSSQLFRYVIIPGGVPSGRKAAIDYSNYEEVKAFYNLPD